VIPTVGVVTFMDNISIIVQDRDKERGRQRERENEQYKQTEKYTGCVKMQTSQLNGVSELMR